MSEPGWVVTEAKCPYCGREWVAVHPADTLTLECPECSIQPDAPEPDLRPA